MSERTEANFAWGGGGWAPQAEYAAVFQTTRGQRLTVNSKDDQKISCFKSQGGKRDIEA